MEQERKLGILQNIYAASVAESVNTYHQLGKLDDIVIQRGARQAQSAPYMMQQLDIGTVEEVFSRLSEVFGCASWMVEKAPEGYVATAKSCKLCALSKRMGGASPCQGWCIDPMEAMIKSIAEQEGLDASIIVEGTLMEHDQCRLAIAIARSA